MSEQTIIDQARVIVLLNAKAVELQNEVVRLRKELDTLRQAQESTEGMKEDGN